MRENEGAPNTDQCIVELSVSALHTLLDMKIGTQVIGLRVVKQGIDGEDIIQLRVAGVGKTPMQGSIPIYQVPITHLHCGHTVLLWDCLTMLAQADGRLAPRRDWPEVETCKPSQMLATEPLIHNKNPQPIPMMRVPGNPEPVVMDHLITADPQIVDEGPKNE